VVISRTTWIGQAAWKKTRNVNKALVGKHNVKRLIGILWQRSEDNIKIL
jgi:hypothetical protein